ncbi:hypothetical protein OC846_001304 [Tilletia horrida]|uniref:Uncharacterized protein n=1 Tax=Tilletia horrida TaxID=155126 RepID=A0AAN6JTM6_9BASI|nr:hypothetical protein OC845_001242 [Tilletia horrida]KAK0556210.1 hypothetical protein OC846_001304 [Tilletia horrida]KAK0569127.1 hypothetical protein OC861_001267 [Tilletia horrida]
MHTLAATATPRLTATLAEDMHVADHATTSSSHTSTGTCSVPRLGLDLIWCSHQRREEEDDNVVTRDSAPLLHALSQTNVVAPPLLAPLMTCLTRTLGARLLQSMTLNVVVRETPLFPLGYGPASSETHLSIPIFNGAFLDRQEAVNPRLAGLARSLTAISWAAQNRIHRRGRAEQDEANAEQWASCENSIGSHIAELTGHTLQEAHSQGDNRFLAILHALLRKNQEMYGPDSIKPKLRMNPSTESVKAAFTSLVAGAPEAPHTTIFQVQEHQNADAALIPFPHPTSTSDHPGEHAAVHAINELRFDDSEDDIWTSPRPVTVSNLPNPAQMADLDAICARFMARAGPKASVEPPESEFEDMDHVAVFEEHELVADVDNVNESPLSGQWEQEFVLLPEDEGERSSVATAHQSTFWFSDGSLADMDGTYDKFGDVILSDLEACPRSHGSTQDCPPSPCLMSMDDANDDEMQYMSE